MLSTEQSRFISHGPWVVIFEPNPKCDAFDSHIPMDHSRHRDATEIIVTKRVDYVHPKVFVRAAEVERLAQNSFKTVFSILRSDEPWVLQMLVDQRSVENALLVSFQNDRTFKQSMG